MPTFGPETSVVRPVVFTTKLGRFAGMRYRILLMCVTVLLGMAVATASASIPHKINYQGQLKDTSTGDPLVGSVNLTFRIYDASLGGTELWTESQSADADANGVVSVVLGSTIPIDIDFDGPVWLQVEVEGQAMSPRREVTSVPFAFYAEKADLAENADSLGGQPSGSYSVEGHNHDDRYYTESELNTPGTINTGTNPVDWTKLKDVPAGFADGTDDGGAGDGYSLDAADGDPTDAVYVDDAGHVGIGTTSPQRLVHIYGGSAGSVPYTSGAEVVIENDGNTRLQMVSPNDKIPGIEFGDTEASGSGYLLYSHAQDKLRLGASGADRIVMDGNGRVGIGTSTPGTDLHIQNNQNAQTTLRIENTNTGSSSSERLGFDNEDGSLAYIAAYDDDSPSVPSSMVIANNRPSGNLRFRTGSTDRLTISNSGEADIYTTTGYPLTCHSGAYSYIDIKTPTSGATGLRMQNTNRTWFLLHGPFGEDRISIYDFDAAAERLTIEGPTGYVGINNTNPDYTLDVAGTQSNVPMVVIQNHHSYGSGLAASADGEPAMWFSYGVGVSGTGDEVGGFFKATSTLAAGGQRAIWASSGASDYAYVCYRHTNGLQYDVYGSGGLALAMPTSKGYKVLTTTESPEAWIEDYGSAEIKGGTCHVDLDPLLLDCVTINEANPIKVFVQLTSPVTNQFYVKKGTDAFDVIVMGEGAETVEGTFDYRVVAARKNREKIRFAEAESPEQVNSRISMAERQTPEEVQRDTHGALDATGAPSR
jgi:hypothetical protein